MAAAIEVTPATLLALMRQVVVTLRDGIGRRQPLVRAAMATAAA